MNRPTLLLLPQRYVFSSKSQQLVLLKMVLISCCCYHKGTYFQANHNSVGEVPFLKMLLLLPQRYVFSSKSQLQPVKLIFSQRCCCYHKGTYFQANHNDWVEIENYEIVVVATTKVRIFKQITTYRKDMYLLKTLLLLPQRYVFSSKSQHQLENDFSTVGCCCYHKGTYFQANHNGYQVRYNEYKVVVATTKVRIFKQITTRSNI